MRALALIALVATSVAAPVAAFDADALARGTWDGFKTACGQVVTDPQGYLNAVPGLAPAGTRPVASSPDGRVVSSAILRNRIHEDVQFVGFPDRMLIHCHVTAVDAVLQTGLPEGMTEQLMANPDMMNDPAFMAQIERNLEANTMLDLRVADTALGAALVQIVGQDPIATLFGGATPRTNVEDYVVVPYNEGTSAAARNLQVYGIQTQFGDVPVHAMAMVEYGALWIGVIHTIEAEQ